MKAEVPNPINDDRTCLSWWFPKLQAAHLPVPRTALIDAGEHWPEMIRVLDGQTVPAFTTVCQAIALHAETLGYPCFLRTGHGSGKHQWERTCFLPEAASIPAHVAALIEWSVSVDLLGLPYRIWAVRELLPVAALAVLPRYGHMPLVREYRAFVGDGRVRCVHHYWPVGAVCAGLGQTPDDPQAKVLCTRLYLGDRDSNEGIRPVLDLALRVAAVFRDHGEWSVDLLATRQGYSVIDMAEAARSFHWPTCPLIANSRQLTANS